MRGRLRWDPYLVFPGPPSSLPLVPRTMWAQRPSESKVRRKGRWEGGSREAVMIGVLGHRVLRHNRATLNVKAKCPRLGSLGLLP